MARYFLTTPIYYVNAYPHLGHAYTTIIVDTVARFYRLLNNEVFFLTGTDEHGDKIQKTAKEKGMEPKTFVDKISGIFKQTWEFLGISFDYFIRTTDENHKNTVQYVLQKLYEKNEIYLDEYEGVYCIGCERFLTNKELDENGCCKDHKTKPIYIKEKNYFFNLEKYRNWLKDYLAKNPVIYPEFYKEEVLNMLEEELPPLCISRPKSRLSWGIELPFDRNFVTYVWFDALINYLTAIGYPHNPEWKKWWEGSHHFIAKDILRPHAIYWPIMLKAMDVPMYKKLYVHGYWLVDKLKMSKSIGNIVDPVELSKLYGKDQLRYFLLREMAFGYDAEFSLSAFINRVNSDLANDYGNLIYRTLTLITKQLQGKVPPFKELKSEDKELFLEVKNNILHYEKDFKNFQFHHALEKLWEGIRKCNIYIDKTAPWKAIKEKDFDRAQTILRTLLECIKSFAIALSPVMPETSSLLLSYIGFKEELTWKKALDFFGLKEGEKVERGKPLYPRIELKEVLQKELKQKAEEERETKEEKVYSIEEFNKWDFRIGEVVSAERIPGTKRLLKLEVKCPEKRQIVSGIAEYYKPEELIGKKIVIVTNLKPAKIKGVLSEGMLLAAHDEKGLTLIVPEKDINIGAKVK